MRPLGESRRGGRGGFYVPIPPMARPRTVTASMSMRALARAPGRRVTLQGPLGCRAPDHDQAPPPPPVRSSRPPPLWAGGAARRRPGAARRDRRGFTDAAGIVVFAGQPVGMPAVVSAEDRQGQTSSAVFQNGTTLTTTVASSGPSPFAAGLSACPGR